jgi:ligand-binding sensor domain-containing protein
MRSGGARRNGSVFITSRREHWEKGKEPMPERYSRNVLALFILILLAGAAAVLLILHLMGAGGAPQARQGWEVLRPPGDVEALVIRGDRVIAGGSDGITVLDRGTGRPVADPLATLPVGRVQALLLDRNGSLWIGHETGLTRVTGSLLEWFNASSGLPEGEVLSLLEDREGRVWAGTWKGAAVQEPGGWRLLTTKDGLLDNNVHAMLEDRSGGIRFGSYVAPRGGVSYYRDGRWQHFNRDQGLPHPNVVAFLEDRNGSVWAGTGLIDRGGAARFVETGGIWSIAATLTAADGLAGNKVRSLFQDRDGVLWFGSEYDGLARQMGSGWQVFTEADGLAHNEVKCIVQDPDGDLWIGTRNGISRIRSWALHAP